MLQNNRGFCRIRSKWKGFFCPAMGSFMSKCMKRVTRALSERPYFQYPRLHLLRAPDFPLQDFCPVGLGKILGKITKWFPSRIGDENYPDSCLQSPVDQPFPGQNQNAADRCGLVPSSEFQKCVKLYRKVAFYVASKWFFSHARTTESPTAPIIVT